MQATLSGTEFQLFKKYIHAKCGIDIGEEKAYLIETRLSKLLADSGMTTFDELYNTIRNNDDAHMAEKIIDAITTNETLWFRDKTPWNILEEILLPQYITKLRNGEKFKIRIWSAASSTGQEAYSTAMCIDRYLKKNYIKDIGLDQFEILATDISKTVLEIARKGRYDAISIMRGMEQEYKDQYFRNEGMVWELDGRIKSAVRFQQFNLQNSYLLFGKFDIIFCRYVLIYFADNLKDEIIKKLSACMHDDGLLFLGASELYGMMDRSFEMKHHGHGTYYKRRIV